MSKKITKIIFFIIAVIILTAIGFLVYFSFQNRVKQNSDEKFLTSIYNEKETYDEIFENLPIEDLPQDIKVGIISHHFLAKNLIAEFYNTFKSDKPLTIFLVAPDHFNNYYKPGVLAYSSLLSWETPFGILKTDKQIALSLEKEGMVKTNDSILALEHGIFIEIPFIKKFFPNAKIVPLVVRNTSNYADFINLGSKIKDIPNSILIVSSDFSHDLDLIKTQENDINSILSLKNILKDDFENNVAGVTNDCKQCLAITAGFLNQGNYDFYLKDNKNSFDISLQDKDNVTSYVSGFYVKKDFVKILFLGDLMFDRGIRQSSVKNGNNFIFKEVFSLLQNNDLVVSNLEGPITKNKSVSLGSKIGSEKNYIFTFEASLAKTLFENNLRLVNLNNNHILNFGQSGLESTKIYLKENNVEYFGDPQSLEQKSIIKEINGIKIAFVSYNQFSGNIDEKKNTINEIKRVKDLSDIVILYAHWGDEYVFNADSNMKELAHTFIDLGADLVVGSHSHTIVKKEQYKEKMIYYSLGNFVFDQYFNEDVRNGLALEVKINLKNKELKFKESRLYLDYSGQTIVK